ncbi:hypothetical protein EV196_10353 [Mariniflexile fucanivorans]|uniref:Uncharacterized protein n=1 Tax=Mariniflexile fucanivorans TaxID=264023 RepID=A0A4R1RKD8_9FLAO|nr:hypothetical protein EV196_10353 [Mariniflexile fucanivorans]
MNESLRGNKQSHISLDYYNKKIASCLAMTGFAEMTKKLIFKTIMSDNLKIEQTIF